MSTSSTTTGDGPNRAGLFGILVFAAVLGMLVWPALADPDSIERYHVLRQADYEAITGCHDMDDWRPLQSAIHFLAFAGSDEEGSNSNLHYARRHTLPLFRALRDKHAEPDGAVAERCIPPSLRRIGFALKLLDAEGRFGRNATPKLDFAYDPSLLKTGSVSPKAFPVMARLDYFALTGCKVSTKNYRRYRDAFDWVVFDMGYRDKARTRMAKFLDVLYAWQRTSDGFVDQRCMIPAISRIASELTLLDENGRYRSRQ